MTADATSAGEFLPVSADAHVNEPHDLWYERLPFPHSQKVTGKLFAEVTAQDRRRVLADNAVEIFGFDPAVVHTPVGAA